MYVVFFFKELRMAPASERPSTLTSRETVEHNGPGRAGSAGSLPDPGWRHLVASLIRDHVSPVPRHVRAFSNLTSRAAPCLQRASWVRHVRMAVLLPCRCDCLLLLFAPRMGGLHHIQACSGITDGTATAR